MDIEAEIARLHGGNKTLAIEPAWHFDSEDQRKWELSVPLDIDYVTEEGLYLDGNCLPDHPDGDVTLVLTYKPASGLSGPISRIDWRPLHSHQNHERIQGPWKWNAISTCHIHAYELNKGWGWKKMVSDNLPIALPVDENLSDFRTFLSYVGRVWNICDIQRVREPEWRSRLA